MSAIKTEPFVLVDKSDGIARLWLNRPQRRHALSLELLQELDHALCALAEEKEIRVVVIGSQGKVFCSGHDLGEMTGKSAEEYDEIFCTCTRMMKRLRQIPQPVVARVQGVATAAGCQLVAACDLAVASDDATFATPGVKIGLFCTTPMVPLVRAIPAKKAMEMLLTGRPISAREALNLGLVNRVVPADQLDAAVQDLCESIMASSSMTIALGKRAFYEQLPLDEPTAYGCAIQVMTDNAMRHDAQEGMRAFLEKRPPEWRGE